MRRLHVLHKRKETTQQLNLQYKGSFRDSRKRQIQPGDIQECCCETNDF